MITHIKSALNQIKAEDDLIKKTEIFLLNAIENKQEEKIIQIKKSRSNFIRKLSIAACIAIVVCISSISGYAYYITPVAFLSIDINPSIELGVNSFNKVISSAGYNDEGKTILRRQNVINLNVKDAVDTIVQSASSNGFIADDGSTIISVTAVTDNATIAEKLGYDSEQGANNAIKTKGITTVIYKDNIPLARRNEANVLGISPGKLNLLQKIQALDSTATVDQYKDYKITDIMKKVVELKKDKISQEIKNGNNKTDSLSTPDISGISEDKIGSTNNGNIIPGINEDKKSPGISEDKKSPDSNQNNTNSNTKDIEKAVEQADTNVHQKKINDNNKNQNDKDTVNDIVKSDKQANNKSK